MGVWESYRGRLSRCCCVTDSAGSLHTLPVGVSECRRSSDLALRSGAAMTNMDTIPPPDLAPRSNGRVFELGAKLLNVPRIYSGWVLPLWHQPFDCTKNTSAHFNHRGVCIRAGRVGAPWIFYGESNGQMGVPSFGSSHRVHSSATGRPHLSFGTPAWNLISHSSSLTSLGVRSAEYVRPPWRLFWLEPL